MKDYIKNVENDKIIFKNIFDNTELIVSHDDNEFIFDTIFLDDKYDLNFIEYIVKELKKTKDIAVIFSLYDSLKLEKLLLENGLKVSNYQYSIKFENFLKICEYDIYDKLDDSGKIFYLKIMNKISKINHEYFNTNQKYYEIDENWFKNDEFTQRIYKKNGKIVGIVDYANIEYNSNNTQTTDIFNYNNKICIRCMLSEDKKVLEDMIKDLLNIYKKDIIINITYTEKNLKAIVEKLNGEFNYCQYTLVDESNNINC